MSTFYIQQFGCRATQADGAALERQLLDRGYTTTTEAAEAAIVVLNTCTVTASADAQARDAIRKIHAQNPAARLIVTGCYAQRAPEELAALPGVTWVVGNSHKPEIPGLVDVLSRAAPPPASDNFFPVSALHFDSTALGNLLIGDIFAHPEFLSAPVQGGEGHHTRPILKIQDGCNLRCSYCVIPFVRGKSRSLPPDAVIREIQQLVGQTFQSVAPPVAQACPELRRLALSREGALLPVLSPLNQSSQSTRTPAREIVLSGINLGTYGRDLTPRAQFIGLLRRILEETQVERLRISSIEPQDVTQDLIDLCAANDRIAQHFHMPLQSASNSILRAMHRRYRIEHYARRLDLIRDRLPNAAIGADLIAGFPGETEADHNATLSFIERRPFTYLHVFSYSSRPGTKAARHPDQVPAATIKRRARELRALSEKNSAAFRQSQINRTLQVLTLHRDEHTDAESTPALSTNYLRVQVPAILPSNLWIEMQITAMEGNHLCGEIIEPELSLFSVPSVSSALSV